MKAILAGVCLLALPVWAQDGAAQSIVFDGKTTRISTFLSDPKFRQLSEWRLDLRLHDFAVSNKVQDLVTMAGYVLYVPANSKKLFFLNWVEPSADSCSVDLEGRTDVLLRLQRRWNPAKGNWPYTIEMWNAVGGGYSLAVCSAGSKPTVSVATNDANDRFTIGGSTFGGDNARWCKGGVGFVRIYPTAMALGTQPPRNGPDQDETLLRLEFEGDPFDWGPFGLETAVEGPLAFANSKVYAPYAETSISEYSANAGATISLDAGASQATAGDGKIASYQWELVQGPGPMEFAANDGAQIAVQATAFGTYLIRLTITDRNGQQASKNVKVGVVPVFANGSVDFSKIPNGELIEFLIGPQLRDGVTPWKWHDQIRRERGDYFGKQARIPPGSVALGGTITVTNGSKIVDGVGTDFLAVFPDCNKATNEDSIIIHYPLPGGGTGLVNYPIASCQSKTRLTLGTPYTKSTKSAVSFGKVGLHEEEFWVERINYYDQALVQYGNYYRTGLDTYLEYARQMADAWWRYARIDEGRLPPEEAERSLVPRRISMTGLILRAVDGRPEMWPFLKSYVDQAWTVWQDRSPVDAKYDYRKVNQFWYGVREPAYVQLYAAQLAKVHPDAAVRQALNDRVLDMALNMWTRIQYPDGSWRWWLNPDSDSWDVYGRGMAEQPFQIGLGLEAMIATYRLTNNPTVLNTILKSVDHLYSSTAFGKPCRGPFYVSFTNLCMTGCTWCDGGVCSKCSDTTSNDLKRETRALNNLNLHAYGFAYEMTRETRYLTAGDDLFSATFGAGVGPGADSLMGLADTDDKQYNQSFRTASSYLGWRAMSTRSVQ